MNCPVCNRTLAPTLSICLTCGAMMNDSVREELQTKIGNSPSSKPAPKMPIAKPLPKPVIPAVPIAKERQPPAMLPPAKLETAQLKNNPKTSPTLVGFQPKNATVPDWRLQLQNSVRGRKASPQQAASEASTDDTFADQRMTNGANALKIQYAAPEPAPEKSESHSDPRVANALKRIADSRRAFLTEPQPKPLSGDVRSGQPKNFKFNVIARTVENEAKPGETRARVNVPPKPRLVPSSTAVKKGYDTNKLPRLPESEVISSIEMDIDPIEAPILDTAVGQPIVKSIPLVESSVEPELVDETESDKIDDLAPFSMRFNAGIFDLLIGAFASLIVLSPLALFGTNWFSAAGAITFIATCAIVMFAYLTVCVGLFGKTVGMRMFSLELVDADESDYPTFHQAAVSSAAYLLTLPLAGIGFVTVFFNDEKRAAHDLLSGTIIVMEF